MKFAHQLSQGTDLGTESVLFFVFFVFGSRTIKGANNSLLDSAIVTTHTKWAFHKSNYYLLKDDTAE